MSKKRRVLVCQYLNCQQNGAVEVLAAFQAQTVPDVEIVASECQGQCNMGPTVYVLPDEVWYCRVKPGDVALICDQHLVGRHPVDRLLHPRFHPK
ncbi:MAG: (2Fe-2S) ferredoxin domain-containing protein [Leptolyngbyaceae cyanobacterium]